MKLNGKGQVTIPADLRHRHGLHPGDEVEVVDDDGVLVVQRVAESPSRGRRTVSAMRGRADTGRSTDELMRLWRDA